MKLILSAAVLLLVFFEGAFCQATLCDLSSELHYCKKDELCNGETCQPAVECRDTSTCTVEGHACIDGFCEPEFCNATGQCVGYHACSMDSTRRCVDRVSYNDKGEGDVGYILPPKRRPHTSVSWYKDSRNNLIVKQNSDQTIYYGDFCSGSSPCTSSTKGEVESTGNLVIFSLVVSDKGYYYYNMDTAEGVQDPGLDYEIYINVTALSRCGGNVTGETGEITSLNYPNNYPSLSFCEWIITVDRHRYISLEISDIDLENCCSCDYIDVRDGPGPSAPLLAKICDRPDVVPPTISTTNNVAYVKFRSDGRSEASGFKLTWKQEGRSCDIDSETNQCVDDSICTNAICEMAVVCTNDADCPAAGAACVGGFCQMDPCTATGQCVGQYECSNDSKRRCIQITPSIVKENEAAKILPPFAVPFDKLTWYLESRSRFNRVAEAESGSVTYYGSFCSSGPGSCATSTEGSLNAVTGELTVNDAQMDDEVHYYYDSDATSGDPDPGIDHAVLLVVHVVPVENQLVIQGLENGVQEGATVELKCLVPRIKPEAERIAWTTYGVEWSNSKTTTFENTDGTLSQVSLRNFTLKIWNDGMEIGCVVRHVDGTELSTSAIVKIFECDETASEPQCKRNQYCKDNRCFSAIPCSTNDQCSPPAEICSSGYCHPSVCTANGQCVYGRVCSTDTVSRCVQPDYQRALENAETTLDPPDYSDFIEFTWYRGSRATPIVHYDPTNGVTYYEDFCAGTSPCTTSNKGEFNIEDGALMLYKTARSDGGTYYYDIVPPSGGDNFSPDYEIRLRVSAEVIMTITGLPEIVESGTTVELTCRVERIEPPLRPVVWEFGARNFTSGVIFWENEDSTNTIVTITPVTLHDSDNGKIVRCFTVYLFGFLETRATIKIGEIPASGGVSVKPEWTIMILAMSIVFLKVTKQ